MMQNLINNKDDMTTLHEWLNLINHWNNNEEPMKSDKLKKWAHKYWLADKIYSKTKIDSW